MTRHLAAVVVFAALAACSRDPNSACPKSFKPLATGTCIAMPSKVTNDTPMLVFLHGMAPSPEVALGNAEELGQSATEAGIVVVAPLGTVGLCGWSPEAAKSWCWPTNFQMQPNELRTLVGRLRADVEEVSVLLGRPAEVRPVIAGFSNGGFAAALLAASAEFEPAGLAVLHAGGPYRWQTKKAVPTLLRTATGDQWHHSTMVELRDQLASAGWTAEWQEREGGHELTSNDVAAIVAFTKKVSASVAAAK